MKPSSLSPSALSFPWLSRLLPVSTAMAVLMGAATVWSTCAQASVAPGWDMNSLRFLACEAQATRIHDIQGSGDQSPVRSNSRTVQAVVVGDFQPKEELDGFFLQEPDSQVDTDPKTSEGLFVFEGRSPLSGSPVDVKLGDLVRVTGVVAEFPEDRPPAMTQLSSVTAVLVCGREVLPVPVDLDWSLANTPSGLGSHEGMRVRILGPLSVTATDNLGRFGEVTLSRPSGPDGPFLYAATELELPGSAPAVERRERNNGSLLLLDDGSSRRDPEQVPYVFTRQTGTASAKTLRRGDTVAQLKGIVAAGFGSYRLHPTEEPVFEPVLPRPVEPPLVPGDIKVASLNVLNYFVTLDDGENNVRGADSLVEFKRQQTKIVAALCSLEADIVSLIEIENNGDLGPSSAIANLARAINSSCDLGYTWVDTGTLGAAGDEPPDVITVGLLYRPASVLAIGPPAVLGTGTFGTLSRPPVAQAFRLTKRNNAPVFTVVTNHFKSKGCRGATGKDVDQGDGQACFNETRTQSSRELLEWLRTDPTGSGTQRVLILGDLNANSYEDPVLALETQGLVNLLKQFVPGRERYSFVFQGEASSLDHALASPSLASHVSGAAIWHINADEPRALDYEDDLADPSTTQDQINHDASLFRGDPFRSSDHDPVIVGLSFE